MSINIRITTSSHAIFESLIHPLSGTTDPLPMQEASGASAPDATVQWGKATTRLGATETWFVIAGSISGTIATSVVAKVIADWISAKIKTLGQSAPDLKQHPLKISVENADGSTTQIEVSGTAIAEIKVKSTPPVR